MLCARRDGHDRIEVGFRVIELWRTRYSWEQLQVHNPGWHLVGETQQIGGHRLRGLDAGPGISGDGVGNLVNVGGHVAAGTLAPLGVIVHSCAHPTSAFWP